MERNTGLIIGVVALIALVMIFTGHLDVGLNLNLQSFLGTETMTRSLPASAENASSFTITWTLVNAPSSGAYAVLVDDVITGGCTFTDGTTRYAGIITNPETSKALTILTPASAGTCTFTGTYSLGNVSTKNFPTQTVTVACVPNTAADTNCDKVVKKGELLAYLQGYIDGQVSKALLLNALQVWMDGGGQ